MTSRTYLAMRLQQRVGADPFYLLSSKASDLLEWADSPRKRVDVRAGYQRDLDSKRVSRIAKFLETSPKNILPSAVLVAVRTGMFRADETGEGLYLVTINVPDEDIRDRRRALGLELKARLSDTEKNSASDLEQVESDVARSIEQETVDNAEADFTPPPSYFSALSAEIDSYDTLPPERQVQIDDFVKSFSKPGLILDGQHRVFGAKEFEDVGEAIELPIVLLPGLAPAEQVFHFYILNNTAKPLDKRQLRSIISTSLSRREIDDLYARFSQARVDPEQAQWTYRVNTDAGSPFHGLINFGLKGDAGPLDDNVMDQVVTAFIKLPKKFFILAQGVPEWKDGTDGLDFKLRLFYALWSAIQERYPNAWEQGVAGGGQLFYKVTLTKLQDFILESLKNVVAYLPSSPFLEDATLKENVLKTLDRLPEEFFLKEWKVKSLDTRDGQEFFVGQIREVIEADGKNLGNRKLFKATG